MVLAAEISLFEADQTSLNGWICSGARRIGVKGITDERLKEFVPVGLNTPLDEHDGQLGRKL